MTETTVPNWTLGWRLRRALAWGNVSANDMAADLGVTPTTISRWCNDKGAPPRPIYLKAWAERCRVPMDWLVKGDDGLPHLDSNQEPSDLTPEPAVPLGTDEIKTLFLKQLGHTGVIRSAVRAPRVVRP